ncbi:MAG: STM4014 family protein [Fimbriiglobus sp.]
MRYIVLANPGTPRGDGYVAELRAFWAARGAKPEIVVVPWAKFLAAGAYFVELPEFDEPAFVKIESPGKSDEVYRQLVSLGCDRLGVTYDGPELPWPKGLLVEPRLHAAGWEVVLERLKSSLPLRPHLRLSASPDAIRTMFDKTATSNLLRSRGITVPSHLEEIPSTTAEIVSNRIWGQETFIKLNHGSSAVGIVHLIGRGVNACTVHISGGNYFNSRAPREGIRHDDFRAADWILSQGAIVQDGIPAARLDGLKFDVRVVCYYGQPVATIFRKSHLPMTNLHLGGQRGDEAASKAQIPKRAWLDGLDDAANAAEAFDSCVCGVDLIFEANYRGHAILEANAFGDHFPGHTLANGQPLRTAEFTRTAERMGWL